MASRRVRCQANLMADIGPESRNHCRSGNPRTDNSVRRQSEMMSHSLGRW